MRLSPAIRSALVVAGAASLPLVAAIAILVAADVVQVASPLGRLLLLLVALAVAGGLLAGFSLADQLRRPLRELGAVVERVAAGDLAARTARGGDDEVARLGETQDRLADDLERRDRGLRAILAAVETLSPREGTAHLVERAVGAAREAFGLIDADVALGAVDGATAEEPIPGEPRSVRADLRVGGESLGRLLGRLPATARWEPGDQALFELFATELASALRNAELFAQVEAQNERLVELDAAKDDFLRGVSHNLQTPLARIRAHADQLAAGTADPADRRPAIIAEQSERLSRMVRQLLTVSRLESGALHPEAEVLALAPRVRRAWEALGADEVTFELDDRSDGWLVVADPDQLDQVLWALLDNAVKHGGGAPVRVRVAAEPTASRVRLTIADAGPGVPGPERDALFARFRRGAGAAVDGSGLGLYVSRRLCRAMGGELELDPPAGDDPGASFSVLLPGEPGGE